MSSLFVLGGARSGKSRYAQNRAEMLGMARTYIATAQAFDNEMRDRIARHQADRETGWDTIEEAIDLPQAISANSASDRVLVVDCLTLWTTNLLLAEHDITAATGKLIDAVCAATGPVILVANEVGQGIVPDNALARRFRDEAGLVNQRVAAAVDEVQLLIAGLPMKLK